MSSSLHQMTPNPQLLPPPNPVRKDGCTHIQMTRLYDPAKVYCCDLCNGQPNIGWLYRCTQATDGSLPLSDFTYASTSQSRQLSDLENEESSSEYPAGDDHEMYMFEEADDELSEALEKSTISGADSTQGSAGQSEMLTTYSTLPTSPSTSTRSSMSANTSTRQSCDNDAMGSPLYPSSETNLSRRPGIDIPRDAQQLFNEITDTPCTFKVCSGCRPIFRERAYQSIDKILNDPMPRVPAWELHNRPVSDARIVAKLGLIKPRRLRRYRPPPPYEPRSHTSAVSRQNSGEAAQSPFHLASGVSRHSVHRRSVFRNTVQTVLRRARSAEAANRVPWTLKDPNGLTYQNKAEDDDEEDALFMSAAMFRHRPLPPLPVHANNTSANHGRRGGSTFPKITITPPPDDDVDRRETLGSPTEDNDDDSMQLD